MTSRASLVLTIGVLLLSLAAVPDADARRIGGVHVRSHVGHVHVRPGRVVGRNYWRRGRWVNGVWVAAGVAATAAAVGTAGNCNYYYRKWKGTGSAYWRNRYYDYCR
ncbi:hypothetical protein [Hyphomicrobium sp.]|uniref:hypothetical protein n=1 Tax=Hyphomicrobium sp. TaxID=82 RepID=UPI002E32D915|nr:hypothetical protein [Hyphomicrobium sp.]HEX2842872.1 hypothetical protein [Hyphomicrobium sp.]